MPKKTSKSSRFRDEKRGGKKPRHRKNPKRVAAAKAAWARRQRGQKPARHRKNPKRVAAAKAAWARRQRGIVTGTFGGKAHAVRRGAPRKVHPASLAALQRINAARRSRGGVIGTLFGGGSPYLQAKRAQFEEQRRLAKRQADIEHAFSPAAEQMRYEESEMARFG